MVNMMSQNRGAPRPIYFIATCNVWGTPIYFNTPVESWQQWDPSMGTSWEYYGWLVVQ